MLCVPCGCELDWYWWCVDDGAEHSTVQHSVTAVGDSEQEALHVPAYTSLSAEAQQNTARQLGNNNNYYYNRFSQLPWWPPGLASYSHSYDLPFLSCAVCVLLYHCVCHWTADDHWPLDLVSGQFMSRLPKTKLWADCLSQCLFLHFICATDSVDAQYLMHVHHHSTDTQVQCDVCQ